MNPSASHLGCVLACLLSVLPLAGSPRPADFGLRDFRVDGPEVKLERERIDGPDRTLVLSQLHNKCYLYLFEGKVKRIWKTPALILDHERPEAFAPDRGGVRPRTDLTWDKSSGRAVLTYHAEVTDPQTFAERVLVVQPLAEGFRVLRLAEKGGAVELRAGSPLMEDEKAWVTAFLRKRASTIYAFPSTTKGPIVLPEAVVQAPPDGGAALARIHQRAQGERGPRKTEATVLSMERFVLDHDVRALEGDLTPLNDLGYWLGESGRPKAALFLLDEVLRRDPARAVAHLNRADVRFALAEQWKSEGTRNEALEDYRAYVRALLEAGKAVPASVTARLKARLGVTALTLESCRSRFGLFEAIEAGDLEGFRSLLERGENPDERNGKGESPAWVALQKERYDMVDLLLDHGADIRGRGTSRSLLAEAVLKAHYRPRGTEPDLRLVERLLGMGAEADPLYSQDGDTLLMHLLEYAAEDEPVVRFVAERSKRLNHAGQYGRTPLHVAAADPDCAAHLKALLKLGGDPNRLDEWGGSVLHRVARSLAYRLGQRFRESRPVDLGLLDEVVAAGARWRPGSPGPLAVRRQWVSSLLADIVRGGSDPLLAKVLQGLEPTAGELDETPWKELRTLLRENQQRLDDPGTLPPERRERSAHTRELERMEGRLRSLGAPEPETSSQPDPPRLAAPTRARQPERILARMASAEADAAYAAALESPAWQYSHPFHDALGEAMALEEQEKYAEAARFYRAVVDLKPQDGYGALPEKRKARARLARLLALGLGVPKDLRAAVAFLDEGQEIEWEDRPWTWADQARLEWGRCLETGQGAPRDVAAALANYRAVAASKYQGCTTEQASFRMGELLLAAGRTLEALKAYEGGGLTGALRLAELYLAGLGGQPRDAALAIQTLEKAHYSNCNEEGQTEAMARIQHRLGGLRLDEPPPLRNLFQAIRHLERAGKLGAAELLRAREAIAFDVALPGETEHGPVIPAPQPPSWLDVDLLATRVFGRLPDSGKEGIYFQGDLNPIKGSQEWLLGAHPEAGDPAETYLAICSLEEPGQGRPLVRIRALADAGLAEPEEEEGARTQDDDLLLPDGVEWGSGGSPASLATADAAWIPLKGGKRLLSVSCHVMEGYAGGGALFVSVLLFREQEGELQRVAHVPVSGDITTAGSWNADGTREHFSDSYGWELRVLGESRDGWSSLRLVPTTKGTRGLTLHWNPESACYEPVHETRKAKRP